MLYIIYHIKTKSNLLFVRPTTSKPKFILIIESTCQIKTTVKITIPKATCTATSVISPSSIGKTPIRIIASKTPVRITPTAIIIVIIRIENCLRIVQFNKFTFAYKKMLKITSVEVIKYLTIK